MTQLQNTLDVSKNIWIDAHICIAPPLLFFKLLWRFLQVSAIGLAMILLLSSFTLSLAIVSSFSRW